MTPAPTLPATHRQVRWWILALLFLVTVINFVDRQALSIVAPILREQLHLSVQDYSQIVAGFAFGMLIGEFPMGWMMDRFGARIVLPLAVVWWSLGNGLHALARTKLQFTALRFWLGSGECANFSGGVKIVQEWFPPKERAFAAGIFNGGATIGSIIAPPLLVAITTQLGWQMAFLLPSAFGVLWVLAWRFVYHPIDRHPHVTAAERFYITADAPPLEPEPSNLELLARRDTWALMLCRMIAGPVPQFYLFWLPEYLYRERGLSLGSIGMFAWIPFFFGDVGSIGGGWLAGWLIRRGWTITRARRFCMVLGALCCLAGLGVTGAKTPYTAIAFICVVLLGHYGFSANMFARISDLTPAPAVSRVTGLTGVSQHISNSLFQLSIGWLVTHFSYGPVFAISAVAPLVAVVVLFGLTRDRHD